MHGTLVRAIMVTDSEKPFDFAGKICRSDGAPLSASFLPVVTVNIHVRGYRYVPLSIDAVLVIQELFAEHAHIDARHMANQPRVRDESLASQLRHIIIAVDFN